jgi:integration host factor subunit alpha
MSLTKQQLIQKICLKLQLSKRESGDLIERLLKLVKSTLESGEHVLISGFGKFCVHERGPMKGCYRHERIKAKPVREANERIQRPTT